ncbi:hypothetical protein AVEN_174186-1 [Araneus ventricosus]|uniref:Uncharacterized protein n=1 Tax=Araneus ventricosus TaxID=182803 RepID=A0A4Y2LB74_ARAVE|nr:hypothetical protein AVEN_264294-1 [Araneus ventricosus]GBN11951.1 hypothetical protein AVEN_174186-1 [Araneus ventricosus]
MQVLRLAQWGIGNAPVPTYYFDSEGSTYRAEGGRSAEKLVFRRRLSLRKGEKTSIGRGNKFQEKYSLIDSRLKWFNEKCCFVSRCSGGGILFSLFGTSAYFRRVRMSSEYEVAGWDLSAMA